MLRDNLLFIHVISAMGMFTALGIEALGLTLLRRASDGSTARGALTALGSSRRISGLSLLVLLLTGLRLAAAYGRGGGAWIGLGLAGLVVIGAIGGLVTGRRISRLQKIPGEGGMSPSLIEALPVLWTSFVMRAALLAGVVYLMTVKPGPMVSLGTLGTATVVGLVLSRVRPRPEALQATRAAG
jgi:hypothetical protein